MDARIDGVSEVGFTFTGANPKPAAGGVKLRDEPRLQMGYLAYASPMGSGALRGYLVRPSHSILQLPAVLVIHDDRGLTRVIEQVADRMAAAGFLSFAPDALLRLGHSGGDDRSRQRRTYLDSEKVTEDFIAAAKFLQSHWATNGHVEVLGVGWGSSIAKRVAERMSSVMTGLPIQLPTVAKESA